MKTLTVNSLTSLFANVEAPDFGAFLAPLDKEAFKKVVTDVESSLRIVNQTLSLLDNALDSGFGSLLDEILNSIALKVGRLLRADHVNIFLYDEEQNEFWTTISKDERGNPVELRIPADAGAVGKVAQSQKAVHIASDPAKGGRAINAEFDEKAGYSTHTVLALPLLSESGALIGVIQLSNKLKEGVDPNAPLAERIDPEGFTSEDEEMVLEFLPSIRLILESTRNFNAATQ